MKIYFLSSQPCALSVNGCYFGLCDQFERFAELSLQENNYILFQPQSANAIGFFLNEDIRFTAPQGCEVYLLPDGICIFARDFPPNDFSLRVYAQLRDGNTLATLYQQGAVQVSIESDFGFFISTLPPSFCNSNLVFHEELLFVDGRTQLAIFNKKGEKLLQESILSYSVEQGELRLEFPLSECLGRVAKCRYSIRNGDLQRIEFSLLQTQSITGQTENLRNELLPFAFFESVLIGADFKRFLSDELQTKADDLPAFLGNFTAVCVTKSPNVCGLVRRKGKDVFTVEYYAVEVKEGKIVDVKG